MQLTKMDSCEKDHSSAPAVGGCRKSESAKRTYEVTVLKIFYIYLYKERQVRALFHLDLMI